MELVWGPAKTKLSLLVVPSLVEQEVILGMDALGQLGVKIDAQKGTAEPTVVLTVVVFTVENPIPEGDVL